MSKVYVICDNDCKYESMTKEQIVAAIAEATGYVPTGEDNAFISQILESNGGLSLSFWLGTQAQFNALGVDAPAYNIKVDENGKVYLAPASELVLPDDSVTSEKLADGSVTMDKVANGAITKEKLASGAVTPSSIGAAASGHSHTPASIGAFATYPQKTVTDANTVYDAGLYLISEGANMPSSYGSLLVLAYRKVTGNSKPDYCVQLFVPTGDNADTGIYYRTSKADTWNEWYKLIPSAGGTLDGALVLTRGVHYGTASERPTGSNGQFYFLIE